MKKILALLLVAVMATTFFGCENQTEAKIYDADTVADALNSQLTFGEVLEKSTADALYSIYGIDPALCTDAACFVNSGAVADEIAVFTCTDEAAVQKVIEAVNSHIEYLHNGYSSYGPDQVPKIENAAVLTKGNTVIMCISENSENAEAIVDSTAITQ